MGKLYTVTIPTVQSGSVDALFAITANATKTLIQVAPSATATDFLVTEISVGVDASAAAQGLQAFLMRQSSAGTGGVSRTPVAVNHKATAATAQSTALTAQTAFSAEPTYVEILKAWTIPQNSGLLVVQFPLGREPQGNAGGNRIALVLRTPTGAAGNASAAIEFEE